MEIKIDWKKNISAGRIAVASIVMVVVAFGLAWAVAGWKASPNADEVDVHVRKIK